MLPSNPDDRAPDWNQVNVGAWGNMRSTQIAGGDITTIRKRNIRIGLAGLAACTLFAGGSIVVVNGFGDDSSITYEEGMTSDDVARVGSADGDKGAAQTAAIYLQAAVVGDAATACQLVGTDARNKRFALRGCETVVLRYGEAVEDANRPGFPQQLRDALGKAQTKVSMRGSQTAEVRVRPSGMDLEPSVTVARENDRWRVIGTSITMLGLS